MKQLLSAWFVWMMLGVGVATYGQVNSPRLAFVPTAPSGACAATAPLQFVTTGAERGDLYGCNSSGMWAAISGSGAVAYTNLEEGVLKRTTFTLSSAEIKALVATPIQVVAAPGTNKIIIPVRGVSWYKRGSASYVNEDATAHISYFWDASDRDWGSQLRLLLQLDMVAAWGSIYYHDFAFLVANTTPSYTLFVPLIGGGSPSFTNLPLYVGSLGLTEYTIGDGTISGELIYRIVDLSGL